MTTHDRPSFAVRIPDAELEPEPLAPDQIVSGTPEVTGKVLWESADGTQVRGIWQITPGVVTDTEANELFVVVSGRATVAVEGGATMEIGAGRRLCAARGRPDHLDRPRDAAQGVPHQPLNGWPKVW
nr:cupin domain-containing protein [Streptomyces sp. QHH-9511]